MQISQRWRATRFSFVLGAALAFAAPARAADPELVTGFVGAIKGCEEWILHPVSWTEGVGPFVLAVGLGNRMGLVDRIDEAALPPEDMRLGNRYWRINATLEAGYFLVVSDQIPMCHVTGGGNVDLQPAVEMVVDSPEFAAHWEEVADLSEGDMASTRYRSRLAPQLELLVSRASGPGARRDRVQVVATAVYRLDEQ